MGPAQSRRGGAREDSQARQAAGPQPKQAGEETMAEWGHRRKGQEDSMRARRHGKIGTQIRQRKMGTGNKEMVRL